SNGPAGIQLFGSCSVSSAGPLRPRFHPFAGTLRVPFAHLRVFVAQARYCSSAVVISFEQFRATGITRSLGFDGVCDVGFAGGPWNEPVLTLAVMFFHGSWARPLLDGCDRAGQP